MITRRSAFAGWIAAWFSGRPATADDVEAFREIEDGWAASVVARDAVATQGYLREGFRVTDAAGGVWDKSPYLDAVGSGAARLKSVRISELAATVDGDTAVVSGRLTYDSASARPELHGSVRFTKVYVRREGAAVHGGA